MRCTSAICDASSSVSATAGIYESSVPASCSWESHGCGGRYYRRVNARLCWNRRCSPRTRPLAAMLSPSSDPGSLCAVASPWRRIPPGARLDWPARGPPLESLRPPPRSCDSSGLRTRPVSCGRKPEVVRYSLSCQHAVSYLTRETTDFFCCSMMSDKCWLCVFASCKDALMSCKSFSRSSTCRGVTLTHIGLPCGNKDSHNSDSCSTEPVRRRRGRC